MSVIVCWLCLRVSGKKEWRLLFVVLAMNIKWLWKKGNEFGLRSQYINFHINIRLGQSFKEMDWQNLLEWMFSSFSIPNWNFFRSKRFLSIHGPDTPFNPSLRTSCSCCCTCRTSYRNQDSSRIEEHSTRLRCQSVS